MFTRLQNTNGACRGNGSARCRLPLPRFHHCRHHNPVLFTPRKLTQRLETHKNRGIGMCENSPKNNWTRRNTQTQHKRRGCDGGGGQGWISEQGVIGRGFSSFFVLTRKNPPEPGSERNCRSRKSKPGKYPSSGTNAQHERPAYHAAFQRSISINGLELTADTLEIKKMSNPFRRGRA